jgi:hypothetical protein
MLEVSQLVGFAVSGGALGSFARSDTIDLDNSTQTTYTFASTAVGTAAADREIVVCVHAQKGSTAALPSGVTLGGTSMTMDGGTTAGGTIVAAIYRLAFPTGTTATLAVTFSSGPGSCAVTVYRMTGRTLPPSVATSTGTSSASHSAAVHVSGSTMICGATEDGTLSPSGFSADQSTGNSFAEYCTGIKTGAGGTISVTTAGSSAAALVSVAYG